MRFVGILFGALFGLFFAGGGTAILFETAVPTFQTWNSMQQWEPATAELLSIKSYDNKTEARYRYAYAGVEHDGDRVYVAHFNDNIGGYHQELQAELNRHLQSGQPINIWVNPIHPRESVIDRDMRWGLFALMSVFCSVFIFIGLMVVYISIRSGGKKPAFTAPSISALKDEWEEKRKNPDFKTGFIEYRRYRLHELKKQARQEQADVSPPISWQKRKGWQSHRIRSQAKITLTTYWGFAVVWNAISSPLLFAFADEWQKGNKAIVLGLLFPLVGVFIVYKAIMQTREYLRFGVIEFEMDPYPGAIGGNVGGRILINRLPTSVLSLPEDTFKVILECVYTYSTGSGKNRSRHEDIKWSEEGYAKPGITATGISLLFRFDVPENLPEADVKQSGNYTFWRLKVEGRVPGIDLNRSYNIPVFNTGEESRSVHHDISEQARQRRAQESAADVQAIASGKFHLTDLSRSVKIHRTSNELSLAFPMFRNKLLTLFAWIFAGGFGFATVSMFSMFKVDSLAGAAMVLFSIPFALVAIFSSIASIYLPFNNLRVTIAGNQLTLLRRILVFPIFYKQIRLGEIRRLSIKKSGSSGQGTKRVEHFKIRAHDSHGRGFTIAEDIDGEDLAEHFKNYLAQQMHLAEPNG